ncbi:hypothetical protein H312_00945, partial [Anncaliia algerae PRA339]
ENMFEWIYNSPGNHCTIGAVERANQTLFNIIRKLCDFGKLQWDTVVQEAVNSYNMSFNRSIQTSPYMLKFGKTPMFEVDRYYAANQVFVDKQTLIDRRNEVFDKYAMINIGKGDILAFNNYKMGDKVLVFREKLGDKLANCWSDGFRIVKKCSSDSYIVESCESRIRVNKKHLKLDLSFRDGDVGI